jgi:hypothetical protein
MFEPESIPARRHRCYTGRVARTDPLPAPLTFQVGYIEVTGLGRSPGDVTINGSIDVYSQCLPSSPGTSNCTALINFWRSDVEPDHQRHGAVGGQERDRLLGLAVALSPNEEVDE